MRKIFLICIYFCLNYSIFAQLYINEIIANNETTIADAQGEFDDWIEIYNAGSSAVSLADYYFTDDLNNPTKWEIPATNATKTTVPANGYLLFWADKQITDGEEHVDFNLSSDGETVYLFATDGTTLIDSLNYPGLSNDVSFGRSTDGNTQVQYFSSPTPLATNASSVDVSILFSEPSQTFIGSLSVTLSTTVNNGVLRYTTNGFEPTSSSTAYSGAISITNNTVLKAKYFFNNGIISNTVSKRYVKMATDMNNISSDIPIILIDTYNQVLDKITTKNAFWSVIEPNNNGRANATDPSSFSGKVGMKIRGASSSSFAKKQWRAELRNEDDSDLKTKLLGMPSESDWVLYAPGNKDRGLINNALMYDLSRRLGKWAPRTRFVEVYYNDNGGDLSSADYWGVYILMEKIKADDDRVDLAKLKATDNAGDELTGGYLFSLDREEDITTNYTINYYGNNGTGYELRRPTITDITSTQLSYITNKIVEFENALTSSNWLHPTQGYKNFTDINTWMIPHIFRALTKEPDGFHLSHYMYKDKNGLINAGPIWDFDRAINSATDSRSWSTTGWDTAWQGQNGQGNCYYWKGGVNAGAFINQMVDDPDYETLFVDNWFDWRRDDILNTTTLNNIIDSLANILNEAQIRNYNRWTGYDYDPRYGGFWGEINEMKNWFSNRSAWIDSQFIPNPSFNPLGGTITANQNISISNTYGGGTIYYTTDGTDPRLSGGALSSNASTYSGNFNITQPGITYVTARIKSGNTWGAVCQIAFYINDNYQDVIINEIHYNPSDVGLVDGDKFEFIELKNKSADPVNLTGLQFTDGIDYTFPAGSILPANGFIVLADDSLEFINQYGFSANGNYGGNLSNAGEQIVLADYYGNQLDVVLYDDLSPWQIAADGSGPSLGLIDAYTDNTVAANWGIQYVSITPNAENLFCDGSLTYNQTQANISCNGANDGFISGNVLGGNAPYTYQWNNGLTSNTISNLTPGTYTLTLTDAYACQYIQSYTITEPNVLSSNITATDQTYFQTNDGTANITINGGTAPYTYSWSNGGTTSSISNLATGNYSVNVTDANNCPLSNSVTIQAVDCSTISASISKTDETYYQSNNGTATTNVSGGLAPYTYSWSNGGTTSSINNLAPSNYSVDILDAAGCLINKNITINSISCNPIVVDVDIINETCIGQSNGLLIIRNISNGIAPYSISWSTGITGSVANNLTTNSYQLAITDYYGCPFQNSYAVEADNIIQASFNVNDVSSANLNDGQIAVTPAGGTSPYTYNWSNGTTNQNLTNAGIGIYSVTITDANGCSEFFDQLSIGNACVASIAQINNPTINSQVYKVANFIQSNGMVNNNEQVSFKAGDYIELRDDFEVIIGAEFEAMIDGCQ